MTSTQTAPARQRGDRRPNPGLWDIVAMGAAFVLFAAASFGPSLVNPVHRMAPLTLLVRVHGVLFTAWLFMFLTQALLIASDRKALHRRLGLASVSLAALMVVTGYQTVIALVKRGFDLSGDLRLGDPVMNAVFPLGDLLTFVALLCAGLWYRRRQAAHKRLMILATIGMMMPASVGHLVGHNFPAMPALVPLLLIILFIAPAVYDRIRFGRFHPITLWGGILLIAWGNVRAILIGPSAGWREFVAWLIS